MGGVHAELARADSTEATRKLGNVALGIETTDALIELGSTAKLEGAACSRRDVGEAQHAAALRWPGKTITMRGTHDRPLLEAREVPHQESHEIVRRFLRLYMLIMEHAALHGPYAGRAAGREVSVVALAARLAIDERTAERMIGILVTGRILRAWQPPAFDRKTGVALPRWLRGETYAYKMYEPVGGLPPALAGHLRRWDGINKERAAAASPARAELEQPTNGAGVDVDGAQEAAAADVVALLAKLRGGGPAPPP